MLFFYLLKGIYIKSLKGVCDHPHSSSLALNGVAPQTLAIHFAEMITLFVFGNPIFCRV